MKKQVLIAGLILLSAVTFGQKKEIKKAQKAIKSGNFTEAINFLKDAESLLANADNDLKVSFYLAKAEAYSAGGTEKNFEKLKTAAAALLKIEDLNLKGADKLAFINDSQSLRAALVNSAIDSQNSKEYDIASDKLHLSYSVSKQDTSDLYYAAANAVNAKNYDKAVEYYERLLKLGYTGIETVYLATEKNSGEEKTFYSKAERDILIKSNDFINPKDKKSKSKKGDILRNLALIYVAKDNIDRAKEVLSKARKENPNDIDLIRTEAELAYADGDIEKYNLLMNEILEKNPNDPDNYFNLGVGATKIGDTEKAMEYYKKAIELNPNYVNAHLNLAALILKPEASIIDEMNSLGTSSADFKKYDELEEQKNNLYKKAVPHLEKALDGKPDNIDLVRTLMNIYSQIGEDDKYKQMKAKVDELTGNN